MENTDTAAALNEVSVGRLLRVRGILLEEFDKYYHVAKTKYSNQSLDTMDILLDFEDVVFPSLSDRLQKLYSKEKKLEIMQSNDEGDDAEADD